MLSKSEFVFLYTLICKHLYFLSHIPNVHFLKVILKIVMHKMMYTHKSIAIID